MTMQKTFHKGLVSITMWENIKKDEKTNEDSSYNTFTVQKSYKDKQGNWQNTSTFTENDLDRLLDCLLTAKQSLVGVRGSTE